MAASVPHRRPLQMAGLGRELRLGQVEARDFAKVTFCAEQTLVHSQQAGSGLTGLKWPLWLERSSAFAVAENGCSPPKHDRDVYLPEALRLDER
jgi:hypothetical protein